MIYPEIAGSIRDGSLRDPLWEIEGGSNRRGDAHCDFAQRRLRVPLGPDRRDRIVRAHELAHVRLSPDALSDSRWPDIPLRALQCAEELRVNDYLGRLGFEVELLRDGSEAASGEQLAHSHQWDEMVFFYFAVHRTGAEKDYVRAIRRVDKDAAASLTAIGAELSAFLRQVPADELASVERDELHDAPRGYVSVTIPLARMATRLAGASAANNRDDLRRLRRSMHPGSRRAASGTFAPLVLATDLTYAPRASRTGARRVTRNSSGRVVRYPAALLVDPQRRIFGEWRRSRGGVVLIDQSGSMDLPQESIDHFLAIAPALTIIGYSHRPGDLTGVPNAWIIADARGRCTHIPSGNVGNGVDGPALAFAATRRRAGDPFIWVSDGQVTDSADHPSSPLAQECADFVRRHRVVVRPSLEGALLALKNGEKSNNPADLGRVGRHLWHRGNTLSQATSRLST